MKKIIFNTVQVLFVIALLTSCKDTKLTKDAIGKWKSELKTEDGKENTYYLLGENGQLEETTFYYQHYTEDGVNVTVKFKSTIKGTWEVLLGDLDFSYDLSSLKVKYIDMDFPDFSAFERELADALISGFAQDLIKDEESELYDNLYGHYQEYRESTYSDIKINGNVMTVTTEDGKIKWRKVKASSDNSSEAPRSSQETNKNRQKKDAKEVEAPAYEDDDSSVTATYERFTDISERLLTEEDIRGFSKPELRILRNEIYARHGHIFKSKDLRDYFSAKDWYNPQYEDVSGLLNTIEKKNVEFIKKHE
jgi:hypothetical protein